MQLCVFVFVCVCVCVCACANLDRSKYKSLKGGYQPLTNPTVIIYPLSSLSLFHSTSLSQSPHLIKNFPIFHSEYSEIKMTEMKLDKK